MRKTKLKKIIGLIKSCKDDAELTDLLEGLFAPQELQTIATRIEILKLLLEGEPQRKIADRLGVGVATVSRGANELKKGRFKVLQNYEKN
jgi:TrpR family trp operon transcriptional repressor